MEKNNILLLVIFAITMIAFIVYAIINADDNSNNSKNSTNDYLGDYDGGHNNYSSTNISQKDENITNSNE